MRAARPALAAQHTPIVEGVNQTRIIIFTPRELITLGPLWLETVMVKQATHMCEEQQGAERQSCPCPLAATQNAALCGYY